MVAALCVLVSHSYALTTGDSTLEPFFRSVGTSLGRMAVDVFFIASGFLICGSMFSRGDALRFVVARCLRVYPALIVAVVTSALVLGPLLTQLGTGQYLSHVETWSYIVKTGSIVTHIQNGLPGVFQSNPLSESVNGSLWTLRYEMSMYCLVLTYWFVAKGLRFSMRSTAASLALASALSMLVYWFGSAYVDSHHDGLHRLLKLSAMFFLGSAAWFYKGAIPLTYGHLACALAALVLSAFSKTVFLLVYPLAICYLVLFFVFGLKGTIAKYNQVGDYSYGVYIFSYPVQQTLVAKFPDIDVARMVLFTCLIVLPMAIASWLLVESRALDLVPVVTQRLQAAFRRWSPNA